MRRTGLKTAVHFGVRCWPIRSRSPQRILHINNSEAEIRVNALDVVWHGTQLEAREPPAAGAYYCTCRFNEMGSDVIEECAAHAMLQREQRALDGLLFARHIVEQLRNEEWSWMSDRHPAGSDGYRSDDPSNRLPRRMRGSERPVPISITGPCEQRGDHRSQVKSRNLHQADVSMKEDRPEPDTAALAPASPATEGYPKD